MPKSPSQLPATFPHPLGSRILKADAWRQASMMRQEFITDLVSLLQEAKEPGLRKRLIALIGSHYRAGTKAAQKSRDLWPESAGAVRELEEHESSKALQRRNLQLFKQFDQLHSKSIEILERSFEHIRVILDKMQAAPEEPGGVRLSRSNGSQGAKPV